MTKYTTEQEIEDNIRTLRELTGLNIVVGHGWRLAIYNSRLQTKATMSYEYPSGKALLRAVIDMKDLVNLALTKGKLIQK